MPALPTLWQVWALLSAVFLRTLAVLPVLALLLTHTRGRQGLSGIPPRSGQFLVVSGLATGASWLRYFRALKLGAAAWVAPVDKVSVVLVAAFDPFAANGDFEPGVLDAAARPKKRPLPPLRGDCQKHTLKGWRSLCSI